MKSIGWMLVFWLAAALWWTPALAGNRAMIQRRVQELHELRQQVMDRLPEEKRTEGASHIRVTVYPREGAILADGAGRRDNGWFGGAGWRGRRRGGSRDIQGRHERYRRRPVEIPPFPERKTEASMPLFTSASSGWQRRAAAISSREL